jgi:GNAT superfamily N-acetyltransferase
MDSKAVPVSLTSPVISEAAEFFLFQNGVPQDAACRDLVRELLESDAMYFLAAAEQESLPGCQLVCMPGLESLAAGCVVQKITDWNRNDPFAWLQEVEHRLLDLGCTHARFYQQFPDNKLERNFSRHGYRSVMEIALLNRLDNLDEMGSGSSEIQLRPVDSETDWSLKLSLHRETSQDPDGHSSSAECWLDMERRKCEAGYMQPYLICFRDDVCGAVNLSLSNRLGRLKNLVIHPRWRRRGIGVEAAKLIASMAREHGKSSAGCFAINDAPSLALYQQAGYLPLTWQIEWFKKLK